MAQCVQVILPKELTPFIKKLKTIRAKNCEPKTNKQIVADAVKHYYDEMVNG